MLYHLGSQCPCCGAELWYDGGRHVFFAADADCPCPHLVAAYGQASFLGDEPADAAEWYYSHPALSLDHEEQIRELLGDPPFSDTAYARDLLHYRSDRAEYFSLFGELDRLRSFPGHYDFVEGTALYSSWPTEYLRPLATGNTGPA